MEKCKHCGREIKSQEEQEVLHAEARKSGKPWGYYHGSYCDGVLTLGTDPFAVEIHEDFSEYWGCEGGRFDSAMEI